MATKKKSWFPSAVTSAMFAPSASAPAFAAEHDSARYTVPLKAIADDLAADRLSEVFVSVDGQDLSKPAKAVESLRRPKDSGWKTEKKAAFRGGRSIIFVSGGITYAELAAAA